MYPSIYTWVFQVVSFPQVSPPKPFMHLPLHHTYYVPRPLLDFITLIIFGEYRSLSSCSFLHSPVTLSLLGPDILLSALVSSTLSLRSSLSVSNQVSDPYKKKQAELQLCIS